MDSGNTLKLYEYFWEVLSRLISLKNMKSWKFRLSSAIMTNIKIGEMPEWLNGAVSKTVVVFWATEGSNPSLSAKTKNSPQMDCFQ